MIIKNYVKHPVRSVILSLQSHKKLDWLPDKTFLKCIYYAHVGKKLNLKNPKTFNEKLQWLKLYDRNLEYSQMVDKYEAKSYAAKIIGDEYIIPTLGVWDNFDEIDFDSLPNRFVLKTTHDCGGVVICKEKIDFDVEAARKKINHHLKRNYYKIHREWPYKNVKPRILAEEFMEDAKTEELRDYKFFCFSGEPKFLYIATERQKLEEETKFDFFDMDFSHLDVRNAHPNAEIPPEKPEKFEEMKVLAAKLSQNIPHVRVDFYEMNGKIYLGELTFYHMSGLSPFEPCEWDMKFGDMIKLPL